MNLKGKDFLFIEEDFFDLDHENKIAHVQLEFEVPSEIFRTNIIAKTPAMTEEFREGLISIFDYVPDRYKVDIRITFDDLEGFTEEELAEICKKNILMQTKCVLRLARRRNRLALVLCCTGVLFILLTMLTDRLWTDEGTAKEVVMYILDIMATVPFWGAMETYFVESSERRNTIRNIKKRFMPITFGLKENQEQRRK